jgi:hypothetical protein
MTKGWSWIRFALGILHVGILVCLLYPLRWIRIGAGTPNYVEFCSRSPKYYGELSRSLDNLYRGTASDSEHESEVSGTDATLPAMIRDLGAETIRSVRTFTTPMKTQRINIHTF